MNSKSPIVFLSAGVWLLLLCPPVFAHHALFVSAIVQAVEKADVVTIKDLFDEPAWKGADGGLSAAALQERLNRGKLIPLRKSSDLKLDAYASNDKFDSRLRCLVTFRLEYGDDTTRHEEIFLLAKRIANDGYSNPKAWRIWRIVVDRHQAECFLGRKFSGAG